MAAVDAVLLRWAQMLKLLTPRQMAAADRAAVRSGISSGQLMAQAGRAAGRAAVRRMGGSYGRRVVVLCGKGNNGGDGFVAARYLAGTGALCTVVLLAEPQSLSGDALEAFEALPEGRGCVVRRYDPEMLEAELARCQLAVDAILGTGFKGTVQGPIRSAVNTMNAMPAPVLAVDIPSGVDGETGRVAGDAVRAAATVTMGALKTGLVLQPGAAYAGTVEVADIGIPETVLQTGTHLAGPTDLAGILPQRPLTAHKRNVGKVLVVAGSRSMPGAAVLAAGGALRAGAGLVRMAIPRCMAPHVGQNVVEALQVGLPETDEGGLSAEAAPVVLELARQMHAVALGPGIGRDQRTMDLVRELVTGVQEPMVLDADGLSAYAGAPEGLRARAGPTVLTPHSGELARLLDAGVAEIDGDRISAAGSAAERTGAVVLLKGNKTVVAHPDGRAVLVDAGGPVLATGGTGDVLTGVIAALVSKLDPFTAAWAGACLHGMAGDMLQEWMGSSGVVAGDLLKALPLAIRQVST